MKPHASHGSEDGLAGQQLGATDGNLELLCHRQESLLVLGRAIHRVGNDVLGNVTHYGHVAWQCSDALVVVVVDSGSTHDCVTEGLG